MSLWRQRKACFLRRCSKSHSLVREVRPGLLVPKPPPAPHVSALRLRHSLQTNGGLPGAVTPGALGQSQSGSVFIAAAMYSRLRRVSATRTHELRGKKKTNRKIQT